MVTHTIETNGTITLTIWDTLGNDSGRYYCANAVPATCNSQMGPIVIVSGDSSTENTSVSILAPAVSASALDSEGMLVRKL
ncbi:UNVERIFIED_CONTAM: hypothetical protein FKN15_050016 [Acipenser sinensis]